LLLFLFYVRPVYFHYYRWESVRPVYNSLFIFAGFCSRDVCFIIFIYRCVMSSLCVFIIARTLPIPISPVATWWTVRHLFPPLGSRSLTSTSRLKSRIAEVVLLSRRMVPRI
jgi:hypothetical protein